MKRRQFIALVGAATLTPLALRAAKTLDYTPGLVADQLAAGKTVFVDFYTDWCSTCRAQGRNIEALRRENPAYDANMVFVKVDWDVHAKSKIARKYRIPRRSTLIVLKGDKELGRNVADPSKSAIKELMDIGLAAANA
ncbi:MAG: thioredoxin family protein [Rhodobacteraceae bacterium]|nr:thioredoxin family protein [Paracoccaceae bacterium]